MQSPPNPTYQPPGGTVGLGPVGTYGTITGPAPGATMGCPHCNAPASPSPEPQTCHGCGRRFALYPGYALDPTVVPPPFDPRIAVVRVKWASLVTYKFGELQAHGVGSGNNDPILGMIPMDQSGVLFPDISSVTFWRKIGWLEAVLATLTFLPITLALLAATFRSPVVFVPMLVFALLTTWIYYQAFFIRHQWVRVVGRYRVLDIRFDRPLWRRKRFYTELLRRTGLPFREMP